MKKQVSSTLGEALAIRFENEKKTLEYKAAHSKIVELIRFEAGKLKGVPKEDAVIYLKARGGISNIVKAIIDAATETAFLKDMGLFGKNVNTIREVMLMDVESFRYLFQSELSKKM